MSQTNVTQWNIPPSAPPYRPKEYQKTYKEILWPLPYLSLASVTALYSVRKLNSIYMPWWIMAPEKIQLDTTFETLPKPARCSYLLDLSAWHRHIMILNGFWRLGRQQKEDGIELQCCYKISRHRWRCRHCRGRVQKQASEGGIWLQYDRSEK